MRVSIPQPTSCFLQPPPPPPLCLGKSKQDSGLHAQSSAQQRTRTGNTSGYLQGTSKLLCVIFVFPSLFTPSVGPLARMNRLPITSSLTCFNPVWGRCLVCTNQWHDRSCQYFWSKIPRSDSSSGRVPGSARLTENQVQKCRLSPVFCPTGLT